MSDLLSYVSVFFRGIKDLLTIIWQNGFIVTLHGGYMNKISIPTYLLIFAVLLFTFSPAFSHAQEAIPKGLAAQDPAVGAGGVQNPVVGAAVGAAGVGVAAAVAAAPQFCGTIAPATQATSCLCCIDLPTGSGLAQTNFTDANSAMQYACFPVNNPTTAPCGATTNFLGTVALASCYIPFSGNASTMFTIGGNPITLVSGGNPWGILYTNSTPINPQ
jgi:hypothetical protein